MSKKKIKKMAPMRFLWFLVFCLLVTHHSSLITHHSSAWAAQEAGEPEAGLPRQEPKKKEVLFSEPELEKIQRRLDQLTEHSQKLRQAIDEIKAELAVIKVRVTN